MDSTQYRFEDAVRQLFRRCLVCPPAALSCPACGPGEICSQISESCSQCASRTCVSANQVNAQSTSGQSTGSGPNVGAIAGGVLGGVVVIAVVTYLIWHFCIKNRRQQSAMDSEEEEDSYPEKDDWLYGPSRNARASPDARGSLASSVFTRASNVIQIAFIPGITGRSDLVPPVPPVPIPTMNVHTSTAYSDNHSVASGAATPYERQHDLYFMPNEAGLSRWSQTTDSDGRSLHSHATHQSVDRSLRIHPAHQSLQSITPSLARESIASTIYRDDAVLHPMPQNALRGRANMVSVKTSPNDSPLVAEATAPDMDYLKSGSAFHAEVPDSSRATTANQSAVERNSSHTANTVSSSGETTSRPGSSWTVAIQEATRRASRQPTHGGLGSVRREPSPFSDENRIVDA